MHELESYLAGEQAVDALREPDATHASAPEQRKNPIRTEASIDERRIGGDRSDQRRRPLTRLVQKACPLALALRGEQTAQQFGRIGIPQREIREPRVTLIRPQLERLIEQLRDPRELLGGQFTQRAAHGASYFTAARSLRRAAVAPFPSRAVRCAPIRRAASRSPQTRTRRS